MKRAFLCVAAVMLVLALAHGDDALAQRKTFLTLSSGSPGGVYYPLGGGMAVIIEKTVEGFRCASESTGASVDRIQGKNSMSSSTRTRKKIENDVVLARGLSKQSN